MAAKNLKTIAIPGVLGFVMAMILFEIQTPEATNSVPERTVRESSTDMQHHFRTIDGDAMDTQLAHFQTSDFYRTIIDNNLFRPLGWRPPRPREPYRLLGTIMPKNADALPNAIIQATAGNKTYIVPIGDKLDTDTTLTDIQPKQVTLSTKGKHRTLRLFDQRVATVEWEEILPKLLGQSPVFTDTTI